MLINNDYFEHDMALHGGHKCQICGKTVFIGDHVLKQGGPHMSCYKSNELTNILKELEKELDKNNGIY